MIEPDWPQCLTLWQCVGCGSMGNSEPCLGTCDFKRLMVVGVEDHAELLDYFLTISERLDLLRALASNVAAASESAELFAGALEELRQSARNLLHEVPEELDPPPAVAPDERAEVWLCASCGQVEAPRDCLGICIRRNGEFVRASDHDSLSARIDSARNELRELASLARQVGWTRPRPGQVERARHAFQTKAREFSSASRGL